MKRKEVKELLKEIALELGRAPTYWEVLEWIETTRHHKNFEKIIDEVGQELEKAGYNLLWEYCRKDDAGCVRFEILFNT